MIKSNIAKGQMFIQFPQPIAELQDTPKPRVWVKVANETMSGEEVSLFGIRDKWYITDTYYGYNVRKGDFVPIDDLREVDDICIERGCGFPEEVDF